ncbi:phosphoglycolate phosphatase [Inhella crocodyli]|uniref:Phosphoglycolate phosphatase n=1 Tax=Inhella crocodyli TaxID=2499851 RepID=A0A3S2VI22_9BURK|nr:phosphoglycolate phosphatase [Inhella crocodyli]RVT87717.1 phosphoglycolate phosphatase [Inhella crocodyli]
MFRGVQAVLFDLDGTLIDSAPDLAGATNALRAERGLPPLPLAHLRPWVGSGARGMLAAGLDVAVSHPEFDSLRDRFLALYASRLLQETRPFDGVPTMLAALGARGMPWGIVTNKAERFTLPIHRGMPLLQGARAVVGGDTTPHAKPHPAPLWEACVRMGVPAEACVYVGDDHRDIEAARAAGMGSVAARWGYLGVGSSVAEWGADHVIDQPDTLLDLLA